MTTQPTQKATGVGMLSGKHPLAKLRLFDTNYGPQWIDYGGTMAGCQDTPRKQGDVILMDWFYFFYEGIIRIPRSGGGHDNVLGHWEIMVKGKRLEPLAHQVSEHFKPTLGVDDKEDGVEVASIEISQSKVILQKQWLQARQPGFVPPPPGEDDEGDDD